MTALQQVTSALSSLHKGNIAHRCVLIDNVFIKSRSPDLESIDVVLGNFAYAYDFTTNAERPQASQPYKSYKEYRGSYGEVEDDSLELLLKKSAESKR